MLRVYKYCILPTPEQKSQLANYFGCCRFVYNLALETKMRAWDGYRKTLTYIDLCNQLKELKDTDAIWLRECSSQALQMSLQNLDKAYATFFRGGGFPKFKPKHGRQSVKFPQRVSVNFEKNTVSIPKIKNIECFFHRRFEGRIKTVTVLKTETDKYFISILVDNQKELPKKKPIKEKTAVGVDLGIKTFAVLSDSTSFENPKYLRRRLSRLRIEQRKLKRRFKRGTKEQSKGYQKQKLIVAKLHEHISNQRKDYLHKKSTQIIRSYDTVCLEDLNIQGMMLNEKLALAVGEIGWYTFRTMLDYKADWYGKNIIYINRYEPSSKLCSNCGYLFKELKLRDRDWVCISCGMNHDRDINAAKNIKKIGLRNKPSTVNVSH